MTDTNSCTIPIVVSPDNNYVIPTYVLLHSLIKNKSSKDNYDIIILTNELAEDNFNLLKSLEKISIGISVRLLSAGNNFSNTKIHLKHITVAAMYRLLLPQLLPEYSKCIYIDGDALICNDIAKAYRESVDNFYIAAVRDIEAADYISKFQYDIAPPTDQYINTGFLLMNLENMRKDGLVDRFFELSDKKFLFCDQDIMNIVCHNKIRHLPLKYNAMVKYRFLHYRLKNYKEEITKYFSLNEIYEAQQHPIMIHYAQPIKPWQCKFVYNGKHWNDYVVNSIDSEIREKYIMPYVSKSQKDRKTQFRLGTRYILSKTFVYKYLLKFANKI